MTVHTAQGVCTLIGDKPFKLDLCDLCFDIKSILKMYLRTHQPVNYDIMWLLRCLL